MHDGIALSALPDAAFLALVEGAEVAPQEFDHAAHVRAAFLLLRDEDAFAPALQRMSNALKGITVKAGVPEKYHETITVAFMALVHEKMATTPGTENWPDFATRNRELLETNPLKAFYSREQLASPLARRVFILPTP
jgi:hypothetical protein